MKKVVSLVLTALMVMTMFSACGNNEFSEEVKTDNSVNFTVSFTAGENNTVDLHTKRQQSYIDGDVNDIAKYGKGKKAYDKTNVMTYSYTDDFTLVLSESEDMANPIEFKSVDKVAKVENLKVATKYYVEASVNGDIIKLDSFETADCLPRVINVDGVKNVRDCGGWKTEDGGRVKQGLLYRCGRMNESNAQQNNIEVTQSGIETMVGMLGIKSDIDLRGFETGETSGITESPLGRSVNYYNESMPYDPDIYLGNEDKLLEVFKILADESNYPIAFHCNIGTDRTGMVAFLVNGLLGVSEEDLFRDYCFSNLADIGGSRSISGLKNHEYYKLLMTMDGETLPEKIHNFLLNLGVTEQEISSIISILKEA